MTDHKKSKFGAGVMFGFLLGALGGLFLAPKSGKENRDEATKKLNEWKDMIESGEMKKKIEDTFGELSEESVRIYTNVRDEVMGRVEKMKTMTADDYAQMVQTAIDGVKDGTKLGADKLNKLKDQFIKDYPEVKENVEKKAEKSKLLAKKSN